MTADPAPENADPAPESNPSKEDSARLAALIAEATAASAAVEDIRAKVAEALPAVLETKQQATTALQEVLDAKAKADGEARHAHVAKGHTEDHAKAVAGLKGEMDAVLGSARAAMKEVEQGRSVIVAARTSTDADMKAAQESKKTAEADLTTTRSRYTEDSARISDVRTKAETDGEATAQALKTTQSAQEKATSNAETSDKAWEKVQDLQSKIAVANGDVTRQLESAKASAAEAATLRQSLTDIVAETKTFNGQVQEFRKNLETAVKNYTELNAKVESLLPHAASAGLASAFREQRTRFASARNLWRNLQLVCIAMIAVIATALAWGHLFTGETSDWDAILKTLISRLPILGPLVWLALVAGHHYSLNLRLEEDYAYKEAVSTAFEGYKREMTAVSPEATSELCSGVLATLREMPGRIYESKQRQVTPLTPLADALQDLRGGDRKLPKPQSRPPEPPVS